jgi:hypothetical protein
MTTYTAQVGPDNAATLAETGSIEDIGEGSIQINDLDELRTLAEGADGSITDDEDEGLQIWVGGEGYPLFGEIDAAVGRAQGAQEQYDEAKRMFDRAAGIRDAAVREVVDLAGTAAAAAPLLEMDEATVEAIVGPPAAAAPLLEMDEATVEAIVGPPA